MHGRIDKIMTDYYYPVLNDEINLPMYILGIGARDTEFHFIREDGYPNHQIICCVRGSGHLEVEGQSYEIRQETDFICRLRYRMSTTPQRKYGKLTG